MPNLRIRIELNKGGRGVSGDKLAVVTSNTVAFLSMLCKDLGIKGDQRDWVAVNFENNSVDFDYELIVPDYKLVEKGANGLRSVMKGDVMHASQLGIRRATTLKYSAIASAIDADEIMRFGVYNNGSPEPESWFNLTKKFANNTEKKIRKSVTYYGQVQGIVSALFKEAKSPRIDVRNLDTGELVKCYFTQDKYKEVVGLLEDERAVVFVEGEVTEDLLEPAINQIQVERFTIAPHFDLERYNSFLGKYPHLTGDQSTDEYIDEYRNGRD